MSKIEDLSVLNKTLEEERLYYSRPILGKEMKMYNAWTNPRRMRVDDCHYKYGNEVLDRTGYIPAKEQIDNFKRAGVNLDAYRRSMYSNEPTPENIDINVTAQKSFDNFDAHDLARETSNNLERSVKYEQERQSEEARQKNSEKDSSSGNTDNNSSDKTLARVNEGAVT